VDRPHNQPSYTHGMLFAVTTCRCWPKTHHPRIEVDFATEKAGLTLGCPTGKVVFFSPQHHCARTQVMCSTTALWWTNPVFCALRRVLAAGAFFFAVAAAAAAAGAFVFSCAFGFAFASALSRSTNATSFRRVLATAAADALVFAVAAAAAVAAAVLVVFLSWWCFCLGGCFFAVLRWILVVLRGIGVLGTAAFRCSFFAVIRWILVVRRGLAVCSFCLFFLCLLLWCPPVSLMRLC